MFCQLTVFKTYTMCLIHTERAGAWSTWTGWGSCSESCNQGQQSRSRSCVSVNDTDVMADDCVGDATMTRTCNDFECPGAYQ